jgi:histidine triad (HIT) family protein
MSYDPNNVFAKIIRDEIPAKKVYEDENVLAFHDISCAAPTHVLVIPKGEFKNFVEFTTKESPQKVADFFRKVSEIAIALEADKSGFRLISNIGSDAHQTVPHFHVHILAGKKMGPLISSDNQLR